MLLPCYSLAFTCWGTRVACVLLKTKWQLIIMTDLEELSDSSTSSGDENVEEDPIVVAENAGAIFRIPGSAAIARKRKLPTNKGKYEQRGSKTAVGKSA